MSYGDEWQYTRVDIARYMGWTLDYVDGLSQEDVLAIYAYKRGRKMVNPKLDE